MKEGLVGGIIYTVDVSEPEAPHVIDQRFIPGKIRISQITGEPSNPSLILAISNVESARNRQPWTDAKLESFVFDHGRITSSYEVSLGLDVTAVHSTEDHFIIVRDDDPQTNSRLQIIDIFSDRGEFEAGDEFEAHRKVLSPESVHLQGNILRVVSNVSADSRRTFFQTFDPAERVMIATEVFDEHVGTGHVLHLEERSLLIAAGSNVLRLFDVSEDGEIEAQPERILAGSYDILRVVKGGSRLLAVAFNNDNRSARVSLYDLDDIEPPLHLSAPGLINSEQRFFREGVTILDDGEGQGLLFLSAYTMPADDDREPEILNHIFSFSPTTLMARGIIEQTSPSDPAFFVDDGLLAIPSRSALGLYDLGDLDAPFLQELIEITPNFPQVFVLDDHVIRVRERNALPKVLEVLSIGAHPHSTEPLTTVKLHRDSRVIQVGRLLVAFHEERDGLEPGTWHFEIYDLTHPLEPIKAGAYVMDGLQNAERELWPRHGLKYHVVGQSLVFTTGERHRRESGFTERCTLALDSENLCPDQIGMEDGSVFKPEDELPCEYFEGRISCTRLNDGPEYCRGGFERCTIHGTELDCEPTPSSEVPTIRTCSTHDVVHTWIQHTFHVLDLSDPANPVMGVPMEMPLEDEAVSVLAAGDALYYGYRHPVPRQAWQHYAKYFLRKIDFSDATSPSIGPAINVPGELIFMDGERAYFRDAVYGEDNIEEALVTVRIEDELAILDGYRQFKDRRVWTTAYDGAGHFVVAHLPLESEGDFLYRPQMENPPPFQQGDSMTVSIHDATDDELKELSSLEISYARPEGSFPGLSIFYANLGYLVLNTEDPTRPF
ncbi:MAG: hypothetical protein ACNA8W_20205, partial [Bradymonadaceae bacterium]